MLVERFSTWMHVLDNMYHFIYCQVQRLYRSDREEEDHVRILWL